MKKKVELRKLKRKLGKPKFTQHLEDLKATKIDLIQEIEEKPQEVLIQEKTLFIRLKEWFK